MSFKRRDKIAIALVTGLVAIVVASALIGFVMIQVHANESPYDSGRDHGCSDAGKDPDNRYINRDGNGPDNHTNEFMDGYNDGYDSCSGSGNTDSSGARTTVTTSNHRVRARVKQ